MEWIVEAELLSDLSINGRYVSNAKPLTRCKDCKYYKADDYTGKLACHHRVGVTFIKFIRNLDDFCSRAERIRDDKN